MMQVVMTNIRPSNLYAVHSVKHNQCRPVSTLRLHLQLGKRGPHSGPAAGALRAISAGRGATRQLLCSVCTAGAHRRAAPQPLSAAALLGQVRHCSGKFGVVVCATQRRVSGQCAQCAV